jgi:hypothetical protein
MWTSQSLAGPMQANKSIDTDVLAAGCARLWPAGHFRRYTDGICSAPLSRTGESPAPRASRARRPVGACMPRLGSAPRTAAAFLLAWDHRQSLALRPARAVATLSALAGAARFTPLARSCEFAGSPSRPPQAQSDVRRSGPRQCGHRALGVRQRPRHNMAVDADAQHRTHASRAPVGRRSPLR